MEGIKNFVNEIMPNFLLKGFKVWTQKSSSLNSVEEIKNLINQVKHLILWQNFIEETKRSIFTHFRKNLNGKKIRNMEAISKKKEKISEDFEIDRNII